MTNQDENVEPKCKVIKTEVRNILQINAVLQVFTLHAMFQLKIEVYRESS